MAAILAVWLPGPAVAQSDAARFLRADTNGDGGVNLSDPIRTFEWLFSGQGAPSCLDAADANDDGEANISDGIFTLGFLFAGGAPIPPPGITECGSDPTPDPLDCARFSPCRRPCGGLAGLPCERGEFCDLPSDTCDGADLQGECVSIADPCPQVVDPVCGCDGVTYINDCERIRAGAGKKSDGPCANFCGGFLGLPCGEGQMCDTAPGLCEESDLPGECVDAPRTCPRVLDQVCGCDGVTYANDCLRVRAGATKAYDGPCRPVCGGIAGTPCEPGQVCDLPPGECGSADLHGVCVDLPDACIEVFDPVCGCDGQTYSNDCERILAGAQKNHDGPCEE